MEGLTALGWFNDEGEKIDTGSRIRSNMVLTAKFTATDSSTVIYSAEDETQPSIQDILNDTSVKTLYLPVGTFEKNEGAGNNFSISHGMAIIGGGSSPVSLTDGRAASYTTADVTVINADLTIATEDKVTIKNLYLTNSDSEDNALIEDNAHINHFNLQIENSAIVPEPGKRAVQSYAVPEVDITVKNSYFSLDSAGVKDISGLRVFMNKDSVDTEANLTVENTTISIENEAGRYSTGINLEYVDKVNVNISNCYVAENGHGYGMRLLDCGKNSEMKNKVTINDSLLSGWYAYYVLTDSQNIDTVVNNTVLIGKSTEGDETNPGATIAIETSSLCSITVNGGRIEAYNTYGGMDLFSIYYYNKMLTPAGNSISISPSTELVYSTTFKEGDIEKLRLGNIENITAMYDPEGNVIEESLIPNTGDIRAWDNLRILNPDNYVLGAFTYTTPKHLNDHDEYPSRPANVDEYCDIEKISYMAIPANGILVKTEDGAEIYTDINDLIGSLNTSDKQNVRIFISGEWESNEPVTLNPKNPISIYGNTLNPAMVSGVTISEEAKNNIAYDEYVKFAEK